MIGCGDVRISRSVREQHDDGEPRVARDSFGRPSGRPDEKPPQNVYLREICISWLFCRVLLMMPKFELPSVPLGFPHCGVLKALNASHRNCSCCPFCTE